ncbi:MAG: D-alanine--D-alanine ligase [Candidatus Omnitrophica bacterium]|nr:D-alanine--D-alanine ligase [Candidatus Omnitrophota bacterium]
MNCEIDKLKGYKIGVLAGGSSNEREISLRSGNAVFAALSGAGLGPIFCDICEDNFESLIDETDIDVAFIALHGKFGEDGAVQRMLEKRNITYTGSNPVSSALALDKFSSRERFKNAALTVPKCRLVGRSENITAEKIGFPCVIKPRYEGSSIGLSVVFSEDDFSEGIDKAFMFADEVLIEKFIHGRELTVGIMDRAALPIVEIITKQGVYDFTAKYESDETAYRVPAVLEEKVYSKVQQVAMKAHGALGCGGFSRVDLILSDDEKIFVLEVNTIPGLTEKSLLPMAAKAADLDFCSLCVKMLYSSLKR